MRKSRRAVVGALAGLALVTGCSAGSGGGHESAADAGAGAPQERAVTGETGVGSPESIEVVDLAEDGEALARTARIALEVEQIAAAVARVHALNESVDGTLRSEHLGGGDEPFPGAMEERTASTYAEIVIAVPSSSLDRVLKELGGLGEVLSRDQSAVDVSEEIVDTEARLKTQRASVQRVRELMERANNIEEIVRIESELTQRLAELESLESRLAALEDRVALSPVHISLTTEPDLVDDDDTGFLAGLEKGWDAFVVSAVLLLTVAGALLPFVVLLAIVAAPLVWWLRRRNRRPVVAPEVAEEA